jgi:uncharacterized protein YwgA
MTNDNDRESSPLTMATSLDLVLALLYAPGKTQKAGEPIEGITRLQKLLFLLQQGKGPKTLVAQAKEYKYRPFKMGPFSEGVREDLQILQSAGLLRTEKLEYLLTDDTDKSLDESDQPAKSKFRRVESSRFILTENGLRAAKDLWAGMPPQERDGLAEFKRFFNALTLRQLLIFVYEKYPSYAVASEIKAQLGF